MVLCNAQDGGAEHEATLATAAPFAAIYSAELHGGYSARRDEDIARVIVCISRIRSGVGNVHIGACVGVAKGEVNLA